MKTLYKFKVGLEQEAEVPKESVNDDGQKTITYVTEKKLVEKEYYIKKPTRAMRDEADMFYAKQKSLQINAGVLTRGQLTKILEDGGGIISKKEQEFLDEKQAALEAINEKFKELQKDGVPKEGEEGRKAYEEAADPLLKEMNVLLNDIQRLQISLNDVYQDTAENRARYKTLSWWIVSLAGKDENGKVVNYFKGKNYEEQMDDYDEKIESDDRFDILACEKFAYLIGSWFGSNIAFKEEQFKAADDRWEELYKQRNG